MLVLNVIEVSNELRNDLQMVQDCIKNLVNNYTKHTKEQLKDYIDLREQEESIKSQLS
jgi:hypothetical protein